MLIQFSTKNFRSIKNEIVFSMIAGKDDSNKQNLIKLDKFNDSYLKSAAIYGANASGKTNINRAFTSAILMIRKSNNRQINEKLLEMIPFKFNNKNIKEPSKFEFIFINNNIKYVYGFSADKDKIHEEYLYQYLSAKPSLIFERTNCNEYRFSQLDESKLKDIKSKMTDNKLFLATATTWNYEKTKDAYMWFDEKIDTYSDYLNLNDEVVNSFENDKNGELKKFTISLLKESDIFIKDYNFEVESFSPNNIMAIMNNNQISNENVVSKKIKISTQHEIEDENGVKEQYDLALVEESLGTQNLFFFSPILKETFEKGKTIIIDEIDKSLHPILVELIIKLFNNKELNVNNAQLIFNTHDTNLLSLNLFRRDQIWFVEKDCKKGITDLYPLDDFSVRKTENIQKGYLNGRYGAIPFIVMGDDLWKEK